MADVYCCDFATSRAALHTEDHREWFEQTVCFAPRVEVVSVLDFCYKQFTKVNNLKAFLRQHGLPSTGTWPDLVQTLREGLDGGRIPLDEFRRWFRHAVQGGRKHIFVFRLASTPDLERLQHHETVTELLQASLRRHDILGVDKPETPTCVHHGIVEEAGRVIDICVGFCERLYQPDGESVAATNYYVFVDVFPEKRDLVVWIPSMLNVHTSPVLTEKVYSDNQAQKYARLICDALRITTLEDNLEENARTAYAIWYRNSESAPEIKDRVSSVEDLTRDYLVNTAAHLGLEHFDADKFFLTIHSMWEGALVHYDEDRADRVSVNLDDRDGVVLGSNFGDRMGAYGKTKSDQPAEETEIHYVVRGLVEKDRFMEVQFGWFMGTPSEIIRSSVMASSGYLKIRLGGVMLEEEEIRNVLSKVGKYRPGQRVREGSTPRV